MAVLSADTVTTFPPLMKCLFVGSSVSFLLIVDISIIQQMTLMFRVNYVYSAKIMSMIYFNSLKDFSHK